jgi:hypothetical protein
MRDRLPGVWPGVKDNAVPAVFYALRRRDLASGGDELIQQAFARVAGGDQRGHVRVVVTGDHQDVDRRLRVNVTESYDPLPIGHLRGRDVPGCDSAEQALWHAHDHSCWATAAGAALGHAGGPAVESGTADRTQVRWALAQKWLKMAGTAGEQRENNRGRG